MLAELQENNARKELAGAERKAFAAEVGRLLAKISKNGQNGFLAIGQKESTGHWLVEMAKTSGTPFKTLQNWWSAFCRETGLSITPRQASDERKAFAAEVGRLILKLKENSHQDEIPNGNDRWLLELGDKSGMGKSSVYRWWSAFCQETGKKNRWRESQHHR